VCFFFLPASCQVLHILGANLIPASISSLYFLLSRSTSSWGNFSNQHSFISRAFKILVRTGSNLPRELGHANFLWAHPTN
jgi:hypothetical protein